MWSKFLPLSLVFLLGCLSCETGCSVVQQQQARKTISDAFGQWQESLNYMDERIIRPAYENFTQCTAEALICIEMDSLSMQKLDSINQVYIDPSPDSERIRWAEKTMSELEKQFIFNRKL